MTISRFNAFNRLRDELDRTRQALADRKVIDKASIAEAAAGLRHCERSRTVR